MEKRSSRILFAIALSGLTLAASCAGQIPGISSSRNAKKMDPPRIHASTSSVKKSSSGVYTYHWLEVSGKSVPDVFEIVIIDAIPYQFVQNSNDVGYVMIPEPLDLPDSYEIFSKDDAKRGFYEARARKRNTPNSWIYARRGAFEFFFDPLRVEDLIKAFSLHSLKRDM